VSLKFEFALSCIASFSMRYLYVALQTGLDEDIVKSFEEFRFDGDLLLLLTEENLKEDFNIKNGVTRKRYDNISNPL